MLRKFAGGWKGIFKIHYTPGRFIPKKYQSLVFYDNSDLKTPNPRNRNSISVINLKFLSVSSINTLLAIVKVTDATRNVILAGGLNHWFPWRHLPPPPLSLTFDLKYIKWLGNGGENYPNGWSRLEMWREKMKKETNKKDIQNSVFFPVKYLETVNLKKGLFAALLHTATRSCSSTHWWSLLIWIR